MSVLHALHACTVTRAKALAGSTRGIRDYLYPPFAQLVLSSSGLVYNTTCSIALVFHGHNTYCIAIPICRWLLNTCYARAYLRTMSALMTNYHSVTIIVLLDLLA